MAVAWLILPTYNEAENVVPIVHAARAALREGDRILIVDDNSPDGTGELAEALAARFPGNVSVLHRERKEGLGPAYLAGFQHVLANMDHDRIVQMDADLSHDPAYIPAFLQASEILANEGEVLVAREADSVSFPQAFQILGEKGQVPSVAGRGLLVFLLGEVEP